MQQLNLGAGFWAIPACATRTWRRQRHRGGAHGAASGAQFRLPGCASALVQLPAPQQRLQPAREHAERSFAACLSSAVAVAAVQRRSNSGTLPDNLGSLLALQKHAGGDSPFATSSAASLRLAAPRHFMR